MHLHNTPFTLDAVNDVFSLVERKLTTSWGDNEIPPNSWPMSLTPNMGLNMWNGHFGLRLKQCSTKCGYLSVVEMMLWVQEMVLWCPSMQCKTPILLWQMKWCWFLCDIFYQENSWFQWLNEWPWASTAWDWYQWDLIPLSRPSGVCCPYLSDVWIKLGSLIQWLLIQDIHGTLHPLLRLRSESLISMLTW
jgi:hypothetical protein